MARFRRKIIIIGVVAGVLLLSGLGVGLRLSILNSDVGARLLGQTVNDYLIDRSISALHTIDSSFINLASLGYFTDNSFSIDVDRAETGTCNINTHIVYDTVACDEYGTKKDDFKYETRSFVLDDGTDIDLRKTYVKAQVTVDFEAYFEMSRKFTLIGWLIATAHGEIAGECVFAAGNVPGEFGGETAKGVIAVQLFAEKLLIDELYKEDYVFMGTAVIKAECVKIARTYHIRGVESWQNDLAFWTELDYPTSIKPAGTGHYDLIETAIGDMLLYPSVQEAVEMVQTTNYDPNFETISLDEMWLEHVYVALPYDVLLGAEFETTSMDQIRSNTLEYVQKFSVVYDIVYTVLTGYSSLDISQDGGTYSLDDGYDPLLGEKILAYIGSFMNTWYGKTILIGGLGVVGISIVIKRKGGRSAITTIVSDSKDKVSTVPNKMRGAFSSAKKESSSKWDKTKKVASQGYKTAKDGYEWVKRKITRKG